MVIKRDLVSQNTFTNNTNMKKLKIIFAVILLSALNLNAQDNEYEAGQLHFGPHLSGIIGGSGDDFISGGIFGGFQAGAYGGYSFTDLIGVNVSALYSYEDWFSFSHNYIKVPALLLFQFNSTHIGLGVQYNFLLSTKIREDEGPLSFKGNHLSGVIEVGYFPLIPFFSPEVGLFYEKSIIRNVIRVGYALTPISILDSEGAFSFKSFFLEAGIQYNIGQHFYDKKYSKKKYKSKAKKRRRR